MGYFSTVYNIFRKDVIEELKSREVVNSMLIFSLLVVIVFSFVFEPGSSAKEETVGGILWMSIVFAGILGLNKSMMTEVQGGNLNALMLAPVDKSAVFFGKVISNFTFIAIVEIITIPLFTVLYNVNLFGGGIWTFVTFLLGTYGFAVLGTIFSLISVNTRTREVMLPLLLLPILVPVILASVQSLNVFVMGRDTSEAFMWLKLVAIFDIIFTAVIFAVFDFIVEE
ncbi:heme exporter protein CcmB [Limisalsivibrio acetivorans]|uniref:heme exporter protein CcmB n=1 Tax=Limisalsivibrio acetivorans TaxID=1304888 RepID=UPI0003B62511|nr:heme exporter protein CcmB [Limisalsivibrio acetivorans]